MIPSLVLSLLAVVLETYAIARLLFIIAPPSFPMGRIFDGLFRDYRVVRAIALLVYDLISLAPNCFDISFTGESVPFSVSAIIVLGNRSAFSSFSIFMLNIF